MKSTPLPVPQFDVKLSPDKDASIALPDDVSESSIDCDPDGIPYVAVFHYNSLQILGFTSKGVVTFSSDKMTDIPSPTIQSFFVGSSAVYVLATGLENATTEETTLTLDEEHETKVKEITGDEVKYIARFDRDGSYRGAMKLDIRLKPSQLAAFESGSFLVEGTDENNAPRIALLNSGGQLIGYVHLPKDITDDAKRNDKPPSASASEAETVDILGQLAQLSHSNGNVLLVRMSNGSPIYEIRESSAVRAVKIKIRDVPAVKLLIPSDRNWFLDVTSDFFEKQSSTIYEINPENGEPLREYLLEKKKGVEDQIACQVEGTFIGIRHEKGRLTLLRGTAEPAKAKSQPGRKEVSP